MITGGCGATSVVEGGIAVQCDRASNEFATAFTAYIDRRVALERQRRVRQVHIPSEWSDHHIGFQDGPLAGQRAQVTAAALATVTCTPNYNTRRGWLRV